jgi:hypothetical protein
MFMRGSGLRAAVLCGAMLVAASLPAASAQIARAATIPGSAHPAVPAISGTSRQLFGVYCTSSKSCWAVGSSYKPSVQTNQVLHWNGKRWGAVSVPNPAGTSGAAVNILSAVRCVSASNCWAVGDSSKNAKTYFAVALHWNGKRWARIATPRPGGTKAEDVTGLSDSTCVSAKDCWAVGAYGSEGEPDLKLSNLILHWNGKRWSQERHIPNPSSGSHRVNELDAIRCLSASNCVADGTSYAHVTSTSFAILNEALHWNGKRWTKQVIPNPGHTGKDDVNAAFALACGSPTVCWAAGYYGSQDPTKPKNLNQILRWNGKRWTKSAVPNPGGTAVGNFNQLDGATCSSPKSCWAVGEYELTDSAKVNETLHWNGKKWTKVGAPNPAGSAMNAFNTLYAVRCVDGTNCWAVGTSEKPDHLNKNEILHWNGKRWSVFG